MTSALEAEAAEQGAVPYEGRELVAVNAQPVTVFGTDDPIQIAARTTAIASALGNAIRSGNMMSSISGRDYVLMEGWSYLGAMLGVSPKTRECEPLRDDDGHVFGFTATVDLITKAGDTVGGATAICTRDEKNWSDRDSYALMSMAQTRAAGKAFRMTFGFVMKAAGYEATPAEEMGAESATPRQQPRRATTKKTEADDELLRDLGLALDDAGLKRADLGVILAEVTRPATLSWLAALDNDISLAMAEVTAEIERRVAAGESV